MNLVEAVKEAQARAAQIDNAIADLQGKIADLRAEKVQLAQDMGDIRAFLATKGINA